MNDIVLMHRQITMKGERVEHLISLVPQELLTSTIDRIHPASGDEIVIKVLDEKLEPNMLADKILDDLSAWAERQKQMALAVIDEKDDLPY